jgi:hypothetical protein
LVLKSEQIVCDPFFQNPNPAAVLSSHLSFATIIYHWFGGVNSPGLNAIQAQDRFDVGPGTSVWQSFFRAHAALRGRQFAQSSYRECPRSAQLGGIARQPG